MRRIQTGDRVTAGTGEDRSTGVVIALAGHAGCGEVPAEAMRTPHEPGDAWVAWDSGVRTWVPRADLRRTTRRYSGGRLVEGEE